MIGPPYFPLDERLSWLTSGRRPRVRALPFYVYEFARASGYPIGLDVLRRLREAAPNLAGLKVSDTPWDAFEPYLSLGLDVFVGPEALIHRGIQGGAVGAVSALASPFPERWRLSSASRPRRARRRSETCGRPSSGSRDRRP